MLKLLQLKHRLLALIVLLTSFAAFAKVTEIVAPLDSVRVSTETSTNILFKTCGATVREYDISLSFLGTESNCVEVALGCDADGDGMLGLDEEGMSFGWRRGNMFVAGGDERLLEPSALTNNEPSQVTLKILSRHAHSPKRIEFMCNGVSILPEISSALPVWAYDPSWNMLRMTHRGVDVSDEYGLLKTDTMPLVLRVR